MSGVEEKEGDAALERLLYVHLTENGQVLILPGWYTEPEWVTPARLREELRHCQRVGGSVLYSREDPTSVPSVEVEQIFKQIASYGLPIHVAQEAHPAAHTPPRSRAP